MKVPYRLILKPAPFTSDHIKSFTFKSGESQVQLLNQLSGSVEIFFYYRGDASLISLIMLVDALRSPGQLVTDISLVIPYFPGGRQDRRCNDGESFSARVYADIINALGFTEVTVFDAHSEVTAAVLNRCVVEKNHRFVQKAINSEPKDYCLVSPDAGANKKVFGLAQYLGGPRVIRADKIRDTKDGKIVDTEVFADDLTGLRLIIVDDIISGGRTFIELAKKLKQKNAAVIELITSHDEGIAEEHVLKDAGIDRFITTNSLTATRATTEFSKVFDIEELIMITVP